MVYMGTPQQQVPIFEFGKYPSGHQAQSEECATLHLGIMGSSPTLGIEITRTNPRMGKNDTKNRSRPGQASEYFIDTLKGVKQGSDIDRMYCRKKLL